MRNVSLLILCIVLSIMAWNKSNAQLPKTNIWLLELGGKKDSLYLKNPKKITRDGNYDNQPYFTPDHLGLLFTQEGKDKQTDIFFYYLKSSKTKRITKTKESEYSPKGQNASNFTCVRVDKDSMQRLYSYSPSNSEGKRIFLQSDSIGYYEIVGNKMVYFKITDPPSIWCADSLNEFRISGIPGRCFVASPDQQKIWFGQKMGNAYLLTSMKGDNLSFAQGLPGNAEFFVFYDETTVIINTENGLQVFDMLTGFINNIPFPKELISERLSRFSINPTKTRMAFVFEE